MRHNFPVLFLALALFTTSAAAAGGNAAHVGIVKSVSGAVEVVRNGSTVPAVPNMRLYEGDVVQTGRDGKAGLILEDDTVIALGRKSTVAIEEFLFLPREGRLSAITRILHGTVSFVTGQIAKLAPDLFKVRTPHGAVGVRGTHVLIKVD